MKRVIEKYLSVVLVFLVSTTLLFSCKEADDDGMSENQDAIMTEYSEHMSMIESQNGRRSYFFKTPLLEGYTLAREPYREFRKGIELITYKSDSFSEVSTVLTANYAIFYPKRDLWEAKGDVVVRRMDADSTTLYTQQLFWNAKTDKIYSNVDTRIEKKGGRESYAGESFESDSEFKDWRFRRSNLTLEQELKINEQDSVGRAVEPNPIVEQTPAPPVAKPTNQIRRPALQLMEQSQLPPSLAPQAERQKVQEEVRTDIKLSESEVAK